MSNSLGRGTCRVSWSWLLTLVLNTNSLKALISPYAISLTDLLACNFSSSGGLVVRDQSELASIQILVEFLHSECQSQGLFLYLCIIALTWRESFGGKCN